MKKYILPLNILILSSIQFVGILFMPLTRDLFIGLIYLILFFVFPVVISYIFLYEYSKIDCKPLPLYVHLLTGILLFIIGQFGPIFIPQLSELAGSLGMFLLIIYPVLTLICLIIDHSLIALYKYMNAK